MDEATEAVRAVARAGVKVKRREESLEEARGELATEITRARKLEPAVPLSRLAEAAGKTKQAIRVMAGEASWHGKKGD